MRVSWPDDLGRIARQRRLDLAWSQEDLAARADVTRQWLTRFETGKGDPALSKVLRVIRELRLSMDVAPEDQLAKKRTIPVRTFVAPEMDTTAPSTALSQFSETSARLKLPDAAPTEASRAQMAVALERLAASQQQMRALGRRGSVTREADGRRSGEEE